MELNIENLGVVRQIKIDLSKKFILFCGRNSTGKTYTSFILQAFLSEGLVGNLDSINKFAQQINDKGCFRIEKSMIQEWIDVNCMNVKHKLGSIFGISDSTCNKLFQKFSISAQFTDLDFEKTLALPMSMIREEGNVVWKISKQPNNDIITVECNCDEGKAMLNPNTLRASVLYSSVIRYLALGNDAGVRMLTVERNSIYTFKTELSLSRNELIEQIQQSSSSELDIIGLINKSSRRYPQAVRSSLRIANDLENIQKHESEFADIANLIEGKLLCGEVNMTKNGDVEFHTANMPKTRRLPFHMSSSIVKTMASLVIYLRHIAAKGDMLIVDEPEMNFHPDVQVLLARIFTMLTKRGLQVVVSTHSDYIVREMNNLIMANSIYNKVGELPFNELELQENMLLDPNDISVMLFEHTRKSLVEARSINIDEEGFAIASIDDTINRQNLMAEQLYAELKK